MHVDMLLVSAAKLLRTTLLTFLLILALVLSPFCELPGIHELVVMHLLQHWQVLHRVLP